MDKRVKYLIGLDTETCNGIIVDNKLDLTQSLVYDIGWVITDKQGRIYRTKSYVIYETFIGMKDVMKSAYYADKIPQYEKEIKAGTRKLVRFSTMRKDFIADMKEYNIDTIFAHNASFDVRALNNTIRYLTKSKYRYFFPYNTTVWDTLKMSIDTICKQKTYIAYCEKNNYMTKHRIPRPRATAEILFKYISGNANFIESHTGLKDVLIETQILTHCFKQHKTMRKNLWAVA